MIGGEDLMHGERVCFMWLWLMNKETEKKKEMLKERNLICVCSDKKP